MAADSIQTHSAPWQVRQWGKNLSEWIQLQLSRPSEPDRPDPSFTFPEWIVQLVFWIVVVAGVVWVAWAIAEFVSRHWAGRSARKARRRPQVQTIPQTTDQTVAEWLRQATQFEHNGQWREACRALYMAALQLLHDRAWILHQASRTDGEYVQMVQTLKPSRPLQMLIRTHERSLFGNAPLQADNVQRCRRAYEDIEQR